MTTLRERKKEATREALRQAAIRLYRERGPQSVTVEDICAAAGVSPRTFFNYFETKDEAVLWLDVSASELLRQLLDRPASENPLQAVRAVFAARSAEIADTEMFRERTLLLREHPELAPRLTFTARAFQTALVDGIAQRTGLSTEDVYVRTVAGATFAANRVAITCWQPGSGPDLVTLLHEAMDALEQGLTPPAQG